MPAKRRRRAHAASGRALADTPALDHRADVGEPAFLVPQARERRLGQRVERVAARVAAMPRHAIRSAPAHGAPGETMRTRELAVLLPLHHRLCEPLALR